MYTPPKTPQRRLRLAALIIGLVLSADIGAAPLSGETRAAIESFLVNQAAGAPGKVSARVGDPASAALPPCPALQPFLPKGVAAWGRFSVGVRCPGEQPWTRFLPAQVSVEGIYLSASRPIQAGQVLGMQDLSQRRGDLTRLPRSVLTAPAQAVGFIATNAIAAEAPLRAELLRGAIVIQQGQPVRLTAEGDGFVISTDARALTSAPSGAAVQVKTLEGRLVSAIARPDGSASVQR